MKNISVILVNPQLGENIGSVARIIKNLNFLSLRIVNPRDGWPNINTKTTSAGADDIIENTKIFKTVEDASEDLNYLFATTVRKRDLNIDISNLYNLTNEFDQKIFSNINLKIGILFGCESSGLSNKDLSNANHSIFIPSNLQFPSLNLSHAVAIVCWEFSKILNIRNKYEADINSEIPSLKDFKFFYEDLEKKLQDSRFFHSKHMRSTVMRNIKILFNRSNLSLQEIRTLNGVIKSLYQYNNQA